MSLQDTLERPEVVETASIPNRPADDFAMTPVQVAAFDDVLRLMSSCDIICLTGNSGGGRSLVLRELKKRLNCALLTSTEVMRELNEVAPDHLEEALIHLMRTAFQENDVLLFDDWHAIWVVGMYGSDRPFSLTFAFRSFLTEIAAAGKTFIYTDGDCHPNWLVGATGAWATIRPFEVEDKLAVLEHHWGGPIDRAVVEAVDFTHSYLAGYQLESAAKIMKECVDGPVTAKALIHALDKVAYRSNVLLSEVENVAARGLVGIEDHMEVLQRTVFLPVQEPELAQSLGLSMARGVLLYGPPGTGKTSIGRMMAHEMKGKFFIFDGTMIAGFNGDHGALRKLLDTAAASSPSVIFIDDADVIFRNNQQTGMVRQLLGELDGIANDSHKNVCLVMTAMDISDMPPALVRSGRVEVWLEMELPTLQQRADILNSYFKTMEDAPAFDAQKIASLCEGYTPADLRGLVGDARALAAYDLITEASPVAFDVYLERALTDISARKRILDTL